METTVTPASSYFTNFSFQRTYIKHFSFDKTLYIIKVHEILNNYLTLIFWIYFGVWNNDLDAYVPKYVNKNLIKR